MKNLILLSMALILVSCQKGDEGKRAADNLPESPKGDLRSDATPTSEIGNWFVKDPTTDGFEGVSSERAMKDFALKNQREIIVAVIDSGIDVDHEDLQGKIWINKGETGSDTKDMDKANNGIDDDNNGYVDDVHGWNFLGGPNGENIDHETLEMTREVVAYEKRIAAGETLSPIERAYFEKVKTAYSKDLKEVQETLKEMGPIEIKATAAKNVLKDKLGITDYSKAVLEQITSNDADISKAKVLLLEVIAKYRTVDRFYRIFENAQNSVNYHLNKSYNPRREIVGDDPTDFSQIYYGNNDVKASDPSHGTHVAGIIAAVRGNGKGVDGIAENVKIMVLRVVPDGDERDKDVALAVRYAVKHGAHVINMSFGKSFSPQKAKVDEAFLEAAAKGVLIFHSAGNSAANNDLGENYPNRRVLDANVKNVPERISTWMEVGASSKTKGLSLPAVFSNYGKKEVDLFAPGVDLLSSIPGNTYAAYSGTSMACPAAAGTSALLLSNFEKMTARQAKAILLRQVRLYDGLYVHLPGAEKLDLPVLFSDLSITGGIIDAHSSISLATELNR